MGKEEQEVFLTVSHLKKYFTLEDKNILRAVDDISLSVYKGETLALVGESGCGKSTFGKTVMGIYKPTEGKVIYEGKDMSGFKGRDRKAFARKAQMIFQDPYASLNPRKTIGDIVAEGLDIHRLYTGKERRKEVARLLGLVGLSGDQADRYPHEFSGGQRQRIGIARALALKPEFIVCDEPISALDVSIQAQVVNLMRRLQKQMNLTYLFIAHDLNMVRYIGDRIAVMYLGNLVEIGESDQVYRHPVHPYTQALIESVPVADPVLQQSRGLPHVSGEIPSPINPPPGCVFSTRCPYADDRCRSQKPALKDFGAGHMGACCRAPA